MKILKSIITILSVPAFVLSKPLLANETVFHSAPFQIEWQFGSKFVQKNVKGKQIQVFDVRPYVEVGAYRRVSEQFVAGASVNYAPNSVASDTKGLLNFKILDLHYYIDSRHSISFYGGAMRQNRNYTAMGYSLGIGYGYKFGQNKIITNVSWSRTNTDIGGPSIETGAKDNLVWINLGWQF